MSYRHRVDFEKDVAGDGNPDPEYMPFLRSVPCNLKPMSGGERYRGKQLQAETNYVIETRFYKDIKPNMIATNKYDGTQYTINRVIDVNGRRRELLVEATEVVV